MPGPDVPGVRDLGGLCLQHAVGRAETGRSARTEPHGELGQALIPLGTPLLAAGTKWDTGAAGSHGSWIPRLRSPSHRDKEPG